MHEPLLPCRSLCINVRDHCLPIREALECERFPTTGACVGNISKDLVTKSNISTPTGIANASATGSKRSVCLPISIPMCREGISYNQTIMPNLVGQMLQEDASRTISTFSRLVQVIYSIYILFDKLSLWSFLTINEIKCSHMESIDTCNLEFRCVPELRSLELDMVVRSIIHERGIQTQVFGLSDMFVSNCVQCTENFEF